MNTLEDRAVHDKYQWDSAIKFLEKSLNDKLSVNEQTLRELVIIFCFKWAIPGLFFLNFCLSNTDLIQLSVYKMSEVTALPTEPQPLPIIFLFLLLYGVTKHVSCYFIIPIQLEVAINVMTSSWRSRLVRTFTRSGFNGIRVHPSRAPSRPSASSSNGFLRPKATTKQSSLMKKSQRYS